MTSAAATHRPVRPSFASRLLRWYDGAGRHDLPWQRPRTAYRVWVSEVMLQQTQVATVVPYFRRFLRRFPNIRALATAPLDDVLALWSGLGYYARARNLHQAARMVVAQHGGRFPRTLEAVAGLPGIGRSTAGAILSQAFGQRHAILDGNVRRLLCRWRGIKGWPGAPAVQNRLWALAEDLLPRQRLPDYAQAVMDLGATVCTPRKPRCTQCPLRRDCVALQKDRVQALPTPRPRRLRPFRRARLLLAENAQGAILFERRAPVGLWGGLWCPPVVEADDDWNHLVVRLGLQADSVRALPPLRHAFTHFDLELEPIRLRTHGVAVAESSCAWFTLAETAALGLPAPVRKFLQTLAPSCPEPSIA